LGWHFVIVHVALSADWGLVLAVAEPGTPWRVRFGVTSMLALLVLVLTSVWRRRLRLSYEVWQVLHAVLAVTVVVAALTHVLLVDYYVDNAWKMALWTLMTAAFVGLLGWTRVLRPLRTRRRPWELAQVIHERGDTTVLVLRPHGHDGLRFGPGQFAWITVDRSPNLPFASQVDDLKGRVNLYVVHVLEDAPPGWTGETGYITVEMLQRYLPLGFERFQYFVCGPTPLLDAMEAQLPTIGVPADHVHTECFTWV
jgi:predicted ferric reductase